MKVLITGATGFLGKRVLDRLIHDPTISEIVVVSRKDRQHTSSKVRVIRADLASPGLTDSRANPEYAFPAVDAVVHLAGLYDFSANFSQAYRDNVLATLNLIAWVKTAQHPVPIHFASTYAVIPEPSTHLAEAPLTALPPQNSIYAHTKAIAERVLADSGLPLRVFRLGILVGDSATGQIEKVDGPYLFARLIRSIGHRPFASLIRVLPIPAHPEAVLPLVPLDAAARVFTESLILAAPAPGQPEYYGVFRSDSACVRTVVDSLLSRYLPSARAWYIPHPVPTAVLKAQSLLTHIPSDTFRFAERKLTLDHARFDAAFTNVDLPPFAAYRHQWLSGFENYCSGRT